MFSAVSELLLLGIALKKDAVCLASKDLHSFATKNPSVIIPKPARNKRQEDSKSSVYSTTFGDANFLGIVLVNETQSYQLTALTILSGSLN